LSSSSPFSPATDHMANIMLNISIAMIKHILIKQQSC
jgi:hypothetical protein